MKQTNESWNLLDVIALLAFLIWGGAGLYFTIKHVSAATVTGWSLSPALTQFINLCMEHGDPVLILLAFINTHLVAARHWTSGIARRWGVLVLLTAYGIEWLGVRTGFPFGQYHYTDTFGPMLGPVPLAIPLAWHVVVTNALFVVRMVASSCSRLTELGLVGLLCALYDFVLEPFATKVRHYWVWADGTVPPLNYAAWFVLSALMVALFAPALGLRHRVDLRPVIILVVTLLIFAKATA